jgi:hypothetical protein
MDKRVTRNGGGVDRNGRDKKPGSQHREEKQKQEQEQKNKGKEREKPTPNWPLTKEYNPPLLP